MLFKSQLWFFASPDWFIKMKAEFIPLFSQWFTASECGRDEQRKHAAIHHWVNYRKLGYIIPRNPNFCQYNTGLLDEIITVRTTTQHCAQHCVQHVNCTVCPWSHLAQHFMQCRDAPNSNRPIRASVHFCLHWLGSCTVQLPSQCKQRCRAIKYDFQVIFNATLHATVKIVAWNVAACLHAPEKQLHALLLAMLHCV